MSTIRKIWAAVMFASFMAFCGCGPDLPELPVEDIKPYFGDAAKTIAIDTAYYQVKNAKGEVLGAVLFSSPYSDEVKGFNGPTPLLITLDAQGRIKDVVPLANQETAHYAQLVFKGGLYESWRGLTPAEALEKDVDAVSGATYTSNGVKNSLVARLKAYERQLKK